MNIRGQTRRYTQFWLIQELAVFEKEPDAVLELLMI
jgi:hypothetical protein